MELDESITDAVIRETLEETAWQFTPLKMTGIYRWVHPENGEVFIRHAFSGELGEHYPERPLDKEIITTVWMTRDELQQNSTRLRSPLVLECIDDYLNGSNYSLSVYRDIS